MILRARRHSAVLWLFGDFDWWGFFARSALRSGHLGVCDQVTSVSAGVLTENTVVGL